MQSNLGKLVRLNDDGSEPADNPFADQGGVAAQVWSLGHRNLLGIDFDAQGRLWEVEMGPKGGDELNLVERGGNYGYPLVSNGDPYDGRDIPDHATRPDFDAPKVHWNPVISPTRILSYSGPLFPDRTGEPFMGGLSAPALGRLWEVEMGPKGGDELNLVERGGNYGYPIVSNGDHYDGRDIPDHDTRPEFDAPKVSWNPVISPSSLLIYSGAMFPDWQGDAFIGGLSSQALVRVEFDGDSAREAQRFDMGARIRAAEQGPDGAIWLLEDGEGGRLLKLTPKP